MLLLGVTASATFVVVVADVGGFVVADVNVVVAAVVVVVVAVAGQRQNRE